ncbi:MAG: phosphodiester glycosidase family protein [Bacillota bacterium]|nr:phosphodiester glycosidase family protein [Bacillota bacterium]
MRAWARRAVLLLVLLALGGAGGLRVGPLHELALETVLTTGHAAWARWIASDGEIRMAWARALGDQGAEATFPVRRAGAPDPAVADALRMRHGDPAPATDVRVTPLVHPGPLGWRGWLVEVRDPRSVRLLVSDRFNEGIGQKLHLMAEEAGAVVAWNGGDFYDPMGEGVGQAAGAVVQNGEILNQPDGNYVIGLTEDGHLVFGHYGVEEIRALGIRDAVSWVGPALVVGGKPAELWGDGGWGYGPRTIMGQRADGTLLVVVVDGRQPVRMASWYLTPIALLSAFDA